MAQYYIPTLDEIADASAAIRAGWSPDVFHQRETIAENVQVELLAGMLRPMAIELGYVREECPVVAAASTGDRVAAVGASC